jgi:CDP-ribitol ribitolphosphotransferase
MRLLLYLAKTYSIPVVDPLVLLSESTQDFEIRFYTSKTVQDNFPSRWQKQQVLKTLKEVKNYHPDFVLCPGNYVDFRFPGKKVQIFHGVGIEKESHFVIRDFFDLYLTCGPLVTERFHKMAEAHKFFKVIETGWPKFDHILNYPRHYSLPQSPKKEGKKVILYAPTFSRKMHSAQTILPMLQTIKQEDEIWMIKFHELMDLQQLNELIQENKDTLHIIKESDITPYLHLADILISDTSSVIYEFMSLNKPAISFRTQKYPEKAWNVNHLTELKEAIAKLKFNPSHEQEQSRSFLKKVNPYLDGKVTERILQVLREEKENPRPLAPKPLNLFRKAKILYHYYFKKGHLA